ncbi:two-component system histidine kinase PnpS [Desulfonema magnum]|uniref:histidine kinase n=1 Tax=Desulfonema magnum TaxID=45655 RepID=A0A975BRG8_9BACT|nr:ATP-binding protein [Desulfonema magnum]QTA90346.1 Putative alkaline phosphatase synthesis sensor protein PhoR [Desulfonema magnum]
MKRKRLIWQLYSSYMLIILFSLVMVIWYASHSFQQFFLNQTIANLKTRSQILEKQISQYLSSPDPASVDYICKDIGKAASTRITVILPDGKVIGDSEKNPGNMDNHGDRSEVIRAAAGQTGTAIRYSSTLEQRMMYVATPLKTDNRVKGILRTSIPLNAIDVRLQSIRIRIALGGFFIALLASGIFFYVSRIISRPIEEMKKGADLFAKGELEHRLAAPNTKEMASLAEAMNQMAIRLQERMETVINQRNEYRAVLSSMKEGVIALDMEEYILSINQAAENMLGTYASGLKGRSLQELIRNQELNDFVANTLSTGKTAERDIVLYHKRERILNIRTTPLCNLNETRIGILVVLNDVTRLRHLENVRSDFVANVSHEIRTPLTAIKGFVETLRNDAGDNPEEAGRFLNIIEKHVNRLVAIIEDLLLLSRIEQEDQIRQIQLDERSVKSVILSSVQICQAKAEEKHIRIIPSYDDKLMARTDSQLIEQAVINLLDNAVKYTREHGEIHADAFRKDAEIIISIKDNGIGIEKKHLPRLFERFYRIDNARSRKLGGTGLGLAIVKHITQAHGGYVTVDSTLGEGSTFKIHLPDITP